MYYSWKNVCSLLEDVGSQIELGTFQMRLRWWCSKRTLDGSFSQISSQEREKREREQAKIQAVEDEKKAKKDEEERLRAIAKQAKAGREAHKKEMRRRKKV